MSDTNKYITKFTCSGTGMVVDKQVLDIRNTQCVVLKLKTVHRRNAENNGVIEEEDFVKIKFWSTAADIVKDTVNINDIIWVQGDLRHGEIKAKNFERLGK